MEHLNRVCKTAVANFGSNETPSSSHRVGRCVGILNSIMLNYDKESAVTEISSTQSLVYSSKDKKIIMQHLLNAEVFAYRHNWGHM